MKRLHVFLTIPMLLTVGACTTVVRQPVVVRPTTPAPAMVVRQMPPPIQELPGPPPGPAYAWVQGHWAWQNGAWAWQAGHWYAGAVQRMPPMIIEQITIAPSPAHYWVPGHWQWRRGRWDWRHGHWQA